MKQHIPLIGGLLIAPCGTASAQSSVTIFGLVESMAGRFKGAVTGVNGSDTSISKLDNGGMSTSSIGFRDSEDLDDGHFVTGAHADPAQPTRDPLVDVCLQTFAQPPSCILDTPEGPCTRRLLKPQYARSRSC